MELTRRALALLLLLAALLYSAGSVAQRVAVPPELQAELLAKVAAYDRNFAARAGANAHVLIVVKADDAKSNLFASSVKAALGRIERVGGLPHRETVIKYESGQKLAAQVRQERVAAAFFAPGLESKLGDIRAALSGVDVLTAGAVPEHVPNGAVLSFDLISGKPKLVVDLQQARKQHVDFRADVLKLMKVYR